MIEPEVIEDAEYDGYYTYEISVGDGINITKRKKVETSPNPYTLFQYYGDKFIQEDNIIKPKYNEIIVENVHNGHTVGHGPHEKSYDTTMYVYVEGELELNKSHTEVVNGNMKVRVIFDLE